MSKFELKRSEKRSQPVATVASSANSPVPQVIMPEFQLVEVQPGDSIQAIARKYLGDAAAWQQLVDYNNLPIRQLNINQMFKPMFILLANQSRFPWINW